MTFVYKILFISAALASAMHASALQIQCLLNPDTGNFEATLPWRNTLGPTADLACQKSIYGSSIARSSSKPQNNLADYVPPTTPAIKEGLSSSSNNDFRSSLRTVSSGFVFASQPQDKTLVQMVKRWSEINGYKMKLNGIYVLNHFPKHEKQYADVPIKKIGPITETNSLHSALSSVVRRMNTNEFKGLDFQLMADPNTETVYMAINPKS